ncbi:hypothetical protein RDWZM_001312 [Blomia tropicalis]|uniref:Rho-GAP domain-containing protein n=1 Tax=Blomia tropicalis TaxID=40697 RepID=A0A9Q0MED4_BLOTA|nr:hypothetical protein RDWZM_001312 [Blomia tropicalis]
MDSTTNDDRYSETIDYIKQIEKEIVFTLDDNDLVLKDCITSKDINTYCDILLDKLSQELHITSSLEKVEDFNAKSQTERRNNENDVCYPHEPNSDKFNVNDLYASTDSGNYVNTEHQVHAKAKENDFSRSIDKITNYRYSFYDNSNNISIYVASCSMIDEIQATKAPSYVAIISSQPENVFGYHPEAIQQNSNGFIFPILIENALTYLSKFGLTSVGIFRKSGVKSRINKLKIQIENGEKIDFDSLCVFDVADLVKTWFRDLKPHLISTDLIDSFMKSKDDFSLWHLPDSHRYLLFAVLKFLSLVSSHSKQNQMTSHNLAICFTPSLCECETERHILNAQKCLEYCIDNTESLFYITISTTIAKIPSKLYRHTSTAIISASPQDILRRLLYERNIIDPLIFKWSVKDKKKYSDTWEVIMQFSSFLPNKIFHFKRNWFISNNNSIQLEEIADHYCSTWHIKTNGQGQTQVIHELELDLR